MLTIWTTGLDINHSCIIWMKFHQQFQSCSPYKIFDIRMDRRRKSDPIKINCEIILRLWQQLIFHFFFKFKQLNVEYFLTNSWYNFQINICNCLKDSHEQLDYYSIKQNVQWVVVPETSTIIMLFQICVSFSLFGNLPHTSFYLGAKRRLWRNGTCVTLNIPC